MFVVAGPTASGKTGFAIKLAETLKKRGVCCEIVNADSIQLYKDLKILTAFPNSEEISRVPHHLFGILSPSETYSAAKWKQVTESKIDGLHSRGKIPILCGGTGFYLSSVLRGIAKIPDVPENYRKEVFEKFQNLGRAKFFKKLLELDPSVSLSTGDTQRILRAYEVVTFTGKPLSYWWKQKSSPKYENIKTVVLLPPRDKLKENILARAVQMLNDGAVDEVREFLEEYPNYRGPLDRVIGFIEIQDFLKKKISKEQLIENMFIKTRQYAKRQSTWFRNQMPDATFVEVGSKSIIDKFLIYLLTKDNSLIPCDGSPFLRRYCE